MVRHHVVGRVQAQAVLVRQAAGVTEYLLPPLPNTLYTRDTTCWIYGGCTVNPLFWPARHEETILTASIYKFHPDFAGKVKVWWGDPTKEHGLATLEGGDVMPIGKGNVLIWGILGVQKEAVLAAERVLVTVEEVVDRLDERPGAIVLPSWVVTAVAEVPGGAHPSYAAGYSSRDNAFYSAWDKISRDRDTFTTWMEENVLEARDESTVGAAS